MTDKTPKKFDFWLPAKAERSFCHLWGLKIALPNETGFTYGMSVEEDHVPADVRDGVVAVDGFYRFRSRHSVLIGVMGVEDQMTTAKMLMAERNRMAPLFEEIKGEDEDQRREIATYAQVLGLTGADAEAFVAENVPGTPPVYENFFWRDRGMRLQGVKFYFEGQNNRGWALGLTHVDVELGDPEDG